jgi:RES domain-containing protein
MVVASDSCALATLETAVHLNNTAVLAAYSVCQIVIPEGLCEEVTEQELPDGWDELVVNPLAAQSWGDLWLDVGATPAVKVPSVIVRTQWNVLLNPGHDQFHDIELGMIESLGFDARIKGNPAK